MPALLRLYNSDGTTGISDLATTLNIEDPGYYTIGAYYVKNIGTTTATNVRIGVRCGNGLYTGQANDQGQEILDEKLIEVVQGTPVTGGDTLADTGVELLKKIDRELYEYLYVKNFLLNLKISSNVAEANREARLYSIEKILSDTSLSGGLTVLGVDNTTLITELTSYAAAVEAIRGTYPLAISARLLTHRARLSDYLSNATVFSTCITPYNNYLSTGNKSFIDSAVAIIEYCYGDFTAFYAEMKMLVTLLANNLISNTWKAIGGDFSILHSSDNYLAIADIPAGGSSQLLSFRVNIPNGLSSVGLVKLQGILVSYEE